MEPECKVEGGGGKGGRGSKNREASLTAQCLICTGAAAAHQHYGAVCCYSCRFGISFEKIC